MKTRMCASCKRGEIYDNPATVYVEGLRPSSHGDWMVPYRGYLCEDHLEAEVEDGLIEKKVVRLPEAIR